MILSILLSVAVAAFSPQPADTVVPRSISLSGEWSFQTGDNLAWATPELDDRTWVRIPVPGVWEDAVGEHDGFGWYRRTVELPPELAEGPVGVHVGTVGDAFEVFWNGVSVGRGGSFPPDYLEAPIDPAPILVPPRVLALADGGRHVLAVRVYNEYLYGGLMSGVKVGRYDAFIHDRGMPDVVVMGLASFFVAIGLYHLAFFLRRRGARENLYFAMLSVLVAVYGLTYSSRFSQAIVHHIAPYRLELVAALLAGPVFIALVHRLFDLPVGRVGRVAGLTSLLALPPVLLLPLRTLGHVGWIIDAAIVVGPVVMVARALYCNAQRVPSGWMLLAGTLTFTLAVAYDVGSEYGWVPIAWVLPGGVSSVFWFGFLALILTVGIATAEKWAVAEVNAFTDPLTGLSRRHVFEDALSREAERMRRSGSMVALVLIDLDHFKKVNDSYGHRVGDEVLTRVGQMLRHTARNIDLAARLGGEEFGVVLCDTDMEGALAFAERFQRHLSTLEFAVPGGLLRVTASLGVAAGGDLVNPEDLWEAADRALYQAKHEGRDRTVAVAASPLVTARLPRDG